MKIILNIFLFLFSTHFLLGQTVKNSSPKIIEALESVYDDIAPVISPDENVLYFTKVQHPENSNGINDLGDIWMSKKTDSVWGSAVKLKGPVNNAQYNAVIGFTPDGSIMYVVGNYENYRKGGVSYSRKIGEGWSEPQPIDIPYFKNNSDHLSGSLSKDGKVMVLSLESYGGRGNEDIYYIFRKSIDQWTELRNLGADINTAAQEYTPYLASDNKTLFFSSNGLGGKGSRDVFYSKRLDATWASWSKPENISTLNSEGADWYFKLIEDTDEALMVNTLNSVGLGNVMLVSKPEDIKIEPAIEESMTASSEAIIPNKIVNDSETEIQKISIKFIVKDGLSQVDLNPQIIVKGVNEMNKSSFYEIVLSSGSSYQPNLYKDSIYTVDIAAEGYLDEVRTIKTDSLSDNDTVVFELVKIEKGTTIQLKSVLFERGTSDIIESSYSELDRVANMLKKNENVEIELAGHTDNTGSSRLNIKLSQERADAIEKYLIEKGIDESRLKSKGYGGARPIASNRSEATRQLNRRVEFTIIKN